MTNISPNELATQTPTLSSAQFSPKETSFLESRKNRDNFFNALFLFGSSASIYFFQELLLTFIGPSIMLLAGLIIIPYLFSRFNKSSFFLEKNDITSLKVTPTHLRAMVFCGIPLLVLMISSMQDILPMFHGNFAVYNFIFWLPLLTYLTWHNMPISIIHNRDFFSNETNDSNYTHHSNYKHSSALSNSVKTKSSSSTPSRNYSSSSYARDLTTNPANSWNPSNIYNGRR